MTICEQCNKERQYSTKYDAYYCQACDSWLEGKCGDPNCDFCPTRPEHPSQDREIF
jgi:hypothetical protein